MTDLDAEIARAALLLQQGGIVAFPTETVYGLGGDATSDRAVARIFEAKGRPSFNPLISHVPDLAAARALGEFDERAERLAQVFWPGPLTLVVRRTKDCPVSLLATAGLDTLAIRVPAHPVAQKLLRAVGRPLAAPSANRSGQISPTTAEHVRQGLGAKVDMVIDGGPCTVGIESTIISCLGEAPVVLRPGGIAREDIATALGTAVQGLNADPLVPNAPGQLSSHYAPRAKMRLNAQAPMPDEAWLGFGPDPDEAAALPEDRRRNLSPSADPVEAAANLFRFMHELDASGAATIAVAPVPPRGLGEGINDRLRRAAAPATN